MHKWSAEELAYLREIAPGTLSAEIRRKFNERFGLDIKHSALRGALERYKIRSGLNGKFQKGHTPPNKDKHYVAGGKSVETQFKPGSVPPNRREIGDERVTKDGYLLIKIADGKKNNNWKPKHVLVWEAAHGPIPKGHAIIFADKNNRNFDIDNLVCVSRAELSVMNNHRLIFRDTESTKTGLLIAQVKLAASNLERRAQ